MWHLHHADAAGLCAALATGEGGRTGVRAGEPSRWIAAWRTARDPREAILFEAVEWAEREMAQEAQSAEGSDGGINREDGEAALHRK